MKKILAVVLMAGCCARAQAPNQAVESRPPAAAVVEQVTPNDVHEAVAQIASELAEARIAIQSLRRQAAEWKARALAAEAKMDSQK